MSFFFYGTLIAGGGNAVAEAAHARMHACGPASVRGTLHAIPDPEGWYPALLAGEGDVAGWLYETAPDFGPADLARLDAWEDCDPARPQASLYVRAVVEVTMPDGTRGAAQAYRFNQPLPPGARPIEGGDFHAWRVREGGSVFGAS